MGIFVANRLSLGNTWSRLSYYVAGGPNLRESKLSIICRFKRVLPNIARATLSQRASTTRYHEKSCDVSFKIIQFQNHVEFHSTGAALNHGHSLDESDANKRNSFLIRQVQHDISRGYAPAAILGAIRGNHLTANHGKRNHLIACDGTYLARQDTRGRNTFLRVRSLLSRYFMGASPQTPRFSLRLW